MYFSFVWLRGTPRRVELLDCADRGRGLLAPCEDATPASGSRRHPARVDGVGAIADAIATSAHAGAGASRRRTFGAPAPRSGGATRRPSCRSSPIRRRFARSATRRTRLGVYTWISGRSWRPGTTFRVTGRRPRLPRCAIRHSLRGLRWSPHLPRTQRTTQAHAGLSPSTLSANRRSCDEIGNMPVVKRRARQGLSDARAAPGRSFPSPRDRALLSTLGLVTVICHAGTSFDRSCRFRSAGC